MVFISIICQKSAICMYNMLKKKKKSPCMLPLPSASTLVIWVSFLEGVHQTFIAEGCVSAGPAFISVWWLNVYFYSWIWDCQHTQLPGFPTQTSLPLLCSPIWFPLITAINTQKQYNNLLLSSWFSGRKSPKSQSLKFQFSETVVVSTWDHFSLEI